MPDDDKTPWVVPLGRSHSVTAIQSAHHRLHLFSWVMPAPKDGDGDSLQIAFLVDDDARGTDLLARLGLQSAYELQRPNHGAFAGATVQAFVERGPLDQSGDPRRGTVVARVKLWNDDAVYEVTPRLVEQAASIEQRLVEEGANAISRETQLLSWITRQRYPECFATLSGH